MAGSSIDSSVVLFFFAHEKLLFRCPVENPFAIDVTAASSASISHPLNATLNSSSSSNSASVGGGVPATTNSQSKRASVAVTELSSLADLPGHVDAAGEQDGHHNGNQRSRSPVAAVGLAARHKKKPKKISMAHPDCVPDTATAPYASSGRIDSSGAVAAGPPARSQGSGTKLRRPMPATNSASTASALTQGNLETSAAASTGKLRSTSTFGSSKIRWMGSSRITPAPTTATCVGIHVNSFLHLLRAPFTGFTTINLTNCTLLVLPLTVTGTTYSRGMPKSSGTSAPVDGDGGMAQKLARASTAMLVAAMCRPDTDSGTISRFLQCFMNILYREEKRVQYVSNQIKVMEHLLSEWERGRGEVQGGVASTTPSKEPGSSELCAINSDTTEDVNRSTSRRESAISPPGLAGTTEPMRQPMLEPSSGSVDRFTYLAGHPKATLCVTIAQLAHSINAWCATMRAAEYRLPCSTTSIAAHPFLRFHSGTSSCASQHVALVLSPPPLLSGAILIKDMLRLPLSLLTGVAPRPQHISSIYFNPNPHSLLRLNPGCNLSLSELENEYVEALGRRHARLFPLSAVQMCLARLATPWRIGALNKSLERALIKMGKPRRSTLSRQLQQQKTDGATCQSPVSEALGASHLYGGSEREAHTTVSNALPQASNLDFLAADIVEFLQVQGVILVDREFNVSFTHGDVTPAHVMSKQHSKIAQAQLKLRRNPKTGGVMHLTPLQRVATNTGSQRPLHGAQGRYTTLPSILLLNMLMLLLERGRERPCRSGGVHTGAMLDTSNNGIGTKNPSNVLEVSPQTSLGNDASVSFMSNMLLSSSPLTASTKRPQHIVVGQQNLSATAGPGADERHELVAYCAWGSACTLCQALAANPQCWLLHIKSDYNCCGGCCPVHCQASGVLEVPVTMHFPFLDHSVRVCAHHEAKQHRQKFNKDTGPLSEITRTYSHGGADGAARFSSQHSGTAFGATHTQIQRPWFLKPEIYMGSVESHIMSSFEVFKQLTSSNAASNNRRVNLSLTATASSKAHIRPDRIGDGVRNKGNPHLPSRLNTEKGEDCLFLSAESIPMEARAWLSRFAATIVGRVEYAMERQIQLEHHLISGPLAPGDDNENNHAGGSEVPHGLRPAVCKTSKGSGKASTTTLTVAPQVDPNAKAITTLTEPTSGAACGLKTGVPQTDAAAASCNPLLPSCPPASADVHIPSHSMRYTKRQLPDCNATRPVPLVEYPLLALGKPSESASLASHQEHASAVWRQPKGASARDLSPPTGPLGDHDEGIRLSEVSCVLRSVNRHVPVKALLIVVMHHLVSFTWGKSGVDVEMLVRLLERNLRRLPPLLSNFTYVLQLVEAGWNSKSLGSMLKLSGGGFVLQGSIDGCILDEKVIRDTYSDPLRKSEEDSNYAMNSISEKIPVLSESTPSSVSYSKFTPTLMDYQLLMALEAYDALSLLPTIRTYASSLIEPVPTRLLLHTVVNEFSDVFFIGGSKGGRYGEQVNTRAL
ncbi:unnamed protein product [Phytomonas sp. EM1]|nr:unnamed protein product [Phytomonas sp. EM1]|eukprot:CCW62200.1 unnamed protein product [Phytomonas sp. isolate EM1]